MKMEMKMEMPHACGIIESDMAAMLQDNSTSRGEEGARRDEAERGRGVSRDRCTFNFCCLPGFQ